MKESTLEEAKRIQNKIRDVDDYLKKVKDMEGAEVHTAIFELRQTVDVQTRYAQKLVVKPDLQKKLFDIYCEMLKAEHDQLKKEFEDL